VFHSIATACRLCHPPDMRTLNASIFPLAMLGLASPCLACVMMMPASRAVHVGPTFRIQVEDRGRPVPGLSLQLQASGFSANRVTDERGFAEFDGLDPELYTLRAEHDVGAWPVTPLLVETAQPSGITVPVAWPSIPPVVIRSLRGALHLQNPPGDQPWPELLVSLIDSASGKSLRSTSTTQSGAFDFGDIAPGIYFLQLQPSNLKYPDGTSPSGLIAISVEPGAQAEHAEIDLMESDCGLMYKDLSACPQAETTLGQFRGRVTNEAGTGIRMAEIALFDASGKLIEELRAGASGEFTSTEAVAGQYDLVVRGPVFGTFRTSLVIASAAATQPGALHVELSEWGKCSSARVE